VFRKFDAPRTPKPFGSKPSFGAKPSFGTRPPAARPEGARTERPRGEGRPPFGPKKPFTRSGGAGPSRSGGFAAKGGPFAKFADGKKPFRKPGAPKKPGGGFAPSKRKREEDDK